MSRRNDRRWACFARLCIEEMAGNVVEYGLPKDKRAFSVDIRIVFRREGILPRIRDNSRAFDPCERAKMHEPGDEGKNVGIRLVYGIAGEVTYQNILGMNVLTIRF